MHTHTHIHTHTYTQTHASFIIAFLPCCSRLPPPPAPAPSPSSQNWPDVAYEAVSAGGMHACGLTADSVVECWGSEHHNAHSVPKDFVPA